MKALFDDAFGDQQTSGLVALAGLEHVLDLCTSDDGFDDFRTKLARHFLGDVCRQVIDHIEIFQPDAVTLRKRRSLAVRTHVKADQRRIGRGSKQHIRFRDTANASQQNANLDLVCGDIVERSDNCFD